MIEPLLLRYSWAMRDAWRVFPDNRCLSKLTLSRMRLNPPYRPFSGELPCQRTNRTL